jgi:hypothetical protein
MCTHLRRELRGRQSDAGQEQRANRPKSDTVHSEFFLRVRTHVEIKKREFTLRLCCMLTISILLSVNQPIKQSINQSIYLWLYSPLLVLGQFFSFLIFYTAGRTPWTEGQPFARPLPAHRTAYIQNRRTRIHASSGIRTHDSSSWAGKDSSCLSPRCHCDRQPHLYCE